MNDNENELIWERYLLREKIEVPIRNITLFLKSFNKEVNQALGAINHIKDIHDNSDMDVFASDNTGYYVFKDAYQYENIKKLLSDMQWNLQYLIISIDVNKNITYNKIFENINHMFDYHYDGLLRILRNFEDIYIRYKKRIKEAVDFYTENPEELREYKRGEDILYIPYKVHNLYTFVSEKFEYRKRKLKVLEKRKEDQKDDRHAKWDHDDVEELYHVSIDAKRLAKYGFRKDYKYDEIKGLGSFGGTKYTSFTIDYGIAMNIRNYYRIVWDIANKKCLLIKLLGFYKHLIKVKKN